MKTAAVLLIGLGLATALAGAAAPEAGHQATSGRYQLAATMRNEAWRLDTVEGRLSFCRARGDRVSCLAASVDPGSPGHYQVSALEAGAAWLIDSQTGRLWFCRAAGDSVDCARE